jgi:hypothetical protein
MPPTDASHSFVVIMPLRGASMVASSYLLGSVDELVLPRLSLADLHLSEGFDGLLDGDLLLDLSDGFLRGAPLTQRRLLHLCLCGLGSTSSNLFLTFVPLSAVFELALLFRRELVDPTLFDRQLLTLDAREDVLAEVFLTSHEAVDVCITG